MSKTPQRARPYYENEILRTANADRINALLDEAARQPEKILPRDDFVKLYWLASDILRGEHE